MSVRKKPNGKGWLFEFRFDGKKIKKELNPFTKEIMRTKAECLDVERKYIAHLEEQEKKRNAPTIGLYSLYEEFVKASKSNLKNTTAYRYERFKDIYLSLVGDVPINNLSIKILTEWKDKVIATDNCQSYINRTLNTMKALLEYGSLMYNLDNTLKYPFLESYKKHEILDHEEKKKAISVDDFNKMLGYLELNDKSQYFYYVVFSVLYNSGLRIGELSALTPSDYIEDRLYINKDFVKVGGVEHIQPPKSNNSRRSVQLDSATKALLDDYIKRFKPKGVLFMLDKKRVSHQVLGRMLKKLATVAKIEENYQLSPHALRHSHASNLRAKGWNEYQIAKRLGNTPAVTTSTYIHFDAPDINKEEEE